MEGASVLVDTREPEEVVRHVKEAGCGVVRARLEAGDYVAGEFAFERKGAGDFINSILDGRLFEQAARLRESGLRPVVVIEGGLWRELERRGVHPNAALGAMLALAAMGVSVLAVPDVARLGALLCLAARRGKKGIRVPTPRRKEVRDIKKLQVALLASLPGVGPRRAEELLRRYGTPLRALVNYRSWDLDARSSALVRRVLETPLDGSGGRRDGPAD
jgi:DNA excision repair protein ERCC-4